MEVLKSRKSTSWPWNCLKVTIREYKTLNHPCSSASVADLAASCMSKRSAPIYLGPGGRAKGREVQCRNTVKVGFWKMKAILSCEIYGLLYLSRGQLAFTCWKVSWILGAVSDVLCNFATYCLCCFCCSSKVYLKYSV